MNNAQINAACGKVFEAPGVLNGTMWVRFMGVYPTGNIGVKRASDCESFGAITVTPEKAAPLIATIEQKFDVRGRLKIVVAFNNLADASTNAAEEIRNFARAIESKK